MMNFEYIENIDFPSYIIEVKTCRICFMNKKASRLHYKWFRNSKNEIEQISLIINRLGDNDTVTFSYHAMIDGMNSTAKFRCQYLDSKRNYIQAILYTDLSNYISSVDLSVFSEIIPSGLMLIEISEGRKYIARYVNTGLLDMLGYTHKEYDEYYPHDVLRFIFPDDMEEIMERFRQQIQETGMFRLNGRLKHKHGNLLVVSFAGKLICNIDGKKFLYCTVTDITQKQSLLEETFEEQQVYSVMKNVSSHTLFKYEIKNKKICFYGVSLKRVLDKSFAEYTVEEILSKQEELGYKNEEMRQLFEDMERGITTPRTILVYNKEDKKKWLFFKYDFIFNRNHEIVSAIGEIQDITPQVNAKSYYDKAIALCSIKETCNTQVVINLTENLVVDERSFLSHREKMIALSSEKYFDKVLSVVVDNPEKEKLKSILEKDILIKAFSENQLRFQFDVEITIDKEHRWMRITIELIENPVNNCIIALIKWRNINSLKLQNEINQMLLADTYDFICCIFAKTDSYIMIQDLEKNNIIPNSISCGYEKFINSIIEQYADEEDKCYLKFCFSIKNLVSQLKINKRYTFIGHGMYPDGTPTEKLHQFTYLDKNKGAILYSRSDITNQGSRFSFKSNGKLLSFDLNEVLCVESFGRKCEITTLNGTFVANENISSIQERLPGKTFTRCHRSYIVNTSTIQKSEKNYVQLVNQKEVPINRQSLVFIKNKVKN